MDGGLTAAVLITPPLHLRMDDFLSNRWGPPHQAGARGYLKKGSAPEELIQAVSKLLAGRRYISATLAERFAQDLHEGPDRPAHDRLSAREFEILVMIGSGKTVSQIAEELHLSAATVSAYRTRILEKMKMATTAELMRYAFRNQLVD
jgi:two-component system invasion response regulator UvrY